MGFQMQVLPQAECRDCKPLRADLNAANRITEDALRANRVLMDEIEILTRERDGLKTIVDSVGYVSCEPAGINTTNCQE
jgi:hypothetical protein